jgi:SAM-dependent methyltransferase
MSHPEQILFFKVVSGHLGPEFAGKKILEIGSFDVNGSIRRCFKDSVYSGVDLVNGPGVDIVADGGTIAHPDNHYDLTISSECFEHNPHWDKTLLNMYRMTKNGGLVIFTCATTGRIEHGTSRTSPKDSPGTQFVGWNYYRNLGERDIRRHLDIESLFERHFFLENKYSADLYFVGAKTGAEPLFNFDPESLRAECVKAQEGHRASLNSRSPFSPRRIASFIIRLPLRFARILPERQYQFIAIHYSRHIELIKSQMREWL